MIPHKLQLKNFLSYGSQLQTIDFGHYQLICLSGKNGHGKSALLDAITWAIWGQARKTAATVKPDHNLLRLGQTHMMVIFDFECNGQSYRIKREFTQTASKAHATLEFGIVNPNSNNFAPLTDKTIKATQEKIEQTLRLDFDSFVNSAFLRQGNANEFSKKSAKDRKEVLASILTLNRYEAIRKQALIKIKQHQSEQHALTLMQEKIRQELENLTCIEQALIAHKQEEAILTQEEATLKQKDAALQSRAQRITIAQQAITLLTSQKESSNDDLKKLHSTLQTTIDIARTQRRIKRAAPDITSLQNERSQLVQQRQKLQENTQKILLLKNELLTLEKKLYTHEQKVTEQYLQEKNKQALSLDRLRANKTILQTQIVTGEKELAFIANEITHAQKNLTQLTLQMSPIDILVREIALYEEQLDKRKEKFQALAAHGNTIAAQIKDIKRKKELCSQSDNPSCPLCEQNLSSGRRKFLNNQFDKNERLFHHQIKRLTIQLPRIKESLLERRTLIVKLKQELETSKMVEFQKEELEKKLAMLENTQHELTDLLATNRQAEELLAQEITSYEQTAHATHNIEQLLIEHQPYQDLKKGIAQIEQEITMHQIDEQTYEKLTERLRQIEQIITLHESYQDGESKYTVHTQTINHICNSLKTIRKKIIDLNTQISQLTEETKDLASIQQNLKDLHAENEALARKRTEVLQESIHLHAEKKRLETLSHEQKKIITQQKSLSVIIDDYQIIAQAVGKDGIQALLIEHIVPEIEHEANRLLAKLSNNQTQISIESLRDLKSGGTKETLDINISDEVGIRPYELFSGGEGFRIDFALRIAISKLLARRAGTALQTLIIDEGFGSQDEEGLAQIMDAIYKIQDDFARIIIVSHLPMMKEQFPVHFLVNKGPNGSVVKVMEYD